MKDWQAPTPTTSGGAPSQTTDAAMRGKRADLLLSRLGADLRARQVPKGLTLAQNAAVTQAQAALDAYLSFFYPRDSRWRGGPSR
jgi:hypothetical protein